MEKANDVIAIAIEVTVGKSLYNLVCTYLLQIPSETELPTS